MRTSIASSSRWLVGSSSSRQDGRVVMIVASASRVRWPPDRVPTGRSRSSAVQAEPRGRHRGTPVGVPGVVRERLLERLPVRRIAVRRCRPRAASRSTSATAVRSGARVRARTSAMVARSRNGGSCPRSTRSDGRPDGPGDPCRCGQPPGDRTQQGGLADAVLADQADPATGLGEQVDARQDGAVGVGHGQSGHDERSEGGGVQACGGPSRVRRGLAGQEGALGRRRGRESVQSWIHMMTKA